MSSLRSVVQSRSTPLQGLLFRDPEGQTDASSGQRLWKKVIPKGANAIIKTFYYLRDAQGNTIFSGEEKGAPRDIVVLNAAAGIMVADIAENWDEALRLAAESIDSGAANSKMRELAAMTKP